MKLLELFSGTHSIGKIAKEKGYEVYSLDRDLGAECPFNSGYKSNKHFKEDIMNFNYKQFPKGYFKLITASPVCLWWSRLRATWIGRKLKSHGDVVVTREMIDGDILNYGVPMVDKIFEILDYFEPEYYWIENPQTGRMKEYINELIPYYDVDYCKYCDWGYKKTTRLWTNIEGFQPKICKNDCDNIITIKTQKGAIHSGYKKLIKAKERTLHKKPIGDCYKATDNCNKIHKKSFGAKNKQQKNCGGGSNRLERYRIPPKLIDELLSNIPCE